MPGAAISLDVPPTRSQREVMDGSGRSEEEMEREMDTGSLREHGVEEERELGQADAAMHGSRSGSSAGGGFSAGGGSGGSPLTSRRCGSPAGGLCIASELASVSLRCSSDGARCSRDNLDSAAESGGASDGSGAGG